MMNKSCYEMSTLWCYTQRSMESCSCFVYIYYIQNRNTQSNITPKGDKIVMKYLLLVQIRYTRRSMEQCVTTPICHGFDSSKNGSGSAPLQEELLHKS